MSLDGCNARPRHGQPALRSSVGILRAFVPEPATARTAVGVGKASGLCFLDSERKLSVAAPLAQVPILAGVRNIDLTTRFKHVGLLLWRHGNSRNHSGSDHVSPAGR